MAKTISGKATTDAGAVDANITNETLTVSDPLSNYATDDLLRCLVVEMRRMNWYLARMTDTEINTDMFEEGVL